MTNERDASERYRKAIGKTIALLRTQRGLSLRALSDSSGISLAYLSEIEHGRKEASGTVLSQLAGAFDMSLPELVHAVADRLDADEPVPELSLDGLAPEEIDEVSRFTDWLRWRKDNG